jgi:hypothetical protein
MLSDSQKQDGDHAYKRVVQAFFGSEEETQRSLAVLCESNRKTGDADVITQTVLQLLSFPVHVQLTAVGWQPLKSREMTFPYAHMTLEQRQVLREVLVDDKEGWRVYEHAITTRPSCPLVRLKALDVLQALCSSILSSAAYPDKRLRVAICNIILQRVQANIPIERGVQSALNARLFPPRSETPVEQPRNPQQ